MTTRHFQKDDCDMATERSTAGAGPARRTVAGDQPGDFSSQSTPETQQSNPGTATVLVAGPHTETTTRQPEQPTSDRQGAGSQTRTGDLAASGRNLLDRAREGALNRLDSQRERAASGLTSMVDALRQGGQHIEQQNPTIASYVDTAASQLERFTGGIRGKNLTQIVTDVERFARRRPAMFLGGAFVLGVVAARFLKSSAPENEPWRASSSWPANGTEWTGSAGDDVRQQY